MANESTGAQFITKRNAVVATDAGTWVNLAQIAPYPDKSLIQWRCTLTGSDLGTLKAGASVTLSGLIRWNGAAFANSYSADNAKGISGASLVENTDFQVIVTQANITIQVRTLNSNPMLFTGKLEAEIATDTENF